ncbi:MAG: glycosyl transferase, group 1 [Bryobacterales bacterium]|jgi:glycosyltransferase involved in cell wall biosynthesis|nr:glycosyl transferase, group 1 [Bryobacterales bacterium]
MRILLTDQFSEAGGAQQVLMEAAAGFAERGWELHAAIPEGPVVNILAPLCKSITLLVCGPFTPRRKSLGDIARFGIQFPRHAAAISRVVAREDIDLLYVNGPRVAPAAVWARQGRPVIFHAHSIVTQPLAARLAGHALRTPDVTVLASSHFVAQWLAPLAPDASVRVIYNGVAGFGARPRWRARHTRIAVLGRIAPEKGQLAFVRAARIAAQRNPDLRFQIGGAPMFGGEDYLDAVRAEAGPAVAFTGWTDDVGAFLKQVDLLVVPSESVDANPRVIPEAYAAGVPVLAFDGGGIPELIEHGVTGLLVKRHVPEALAEAILDAVANPEWLNGMAARGYKRWQRCYTLARFQSEVCDAVEGAVRRRREPVRKARASATA